LTPLGKRKPKKIQRQGKDTDLLAGKEVRAKQAGKHRYSRTPQETQVQHEQKGGTDPNTGGLFAGHPGDVATVRKCREAQKNIPQTHP